MIEVRQITLEMNLKELLKSKKTQQLSKDELANEIGRYLSMSHKGKLYTFTAEKLDSLKLFFWIPLESNYSEVLQHFEENLRNGFKGCGNPLFQISNVETIKVYKSF